MEPGLAQFEKEYAQKMKFVDINVDYLDKPEYQAYVELFKEGSGGAIPYTILLDKEGKAVKARLGYMSYDELVAEFGKAVP
jgi:thiol-disulfide isomerase/thioredoxin